MDMNVTICQVPQCSKNDDCVLHRYTKINLILHFHVLDFLCHNLKLVFLLYGNDIWFCFGYEFSWISFYSMPMKKSASPAASSSSGLGLLKLNGVSPSHLQQPWECVDTWRTECYVQASQYTYAHTHAHTHTTQYHTHTIYNQIIIITYRSWLSSG